MNEHHLQYQQFQKLNYVKVSPGPINIAELEKFPDFLVVGPQRTGSTWLSRNLRVHPEIFFSSPKEIYYFSTLKKEIKPQKSELSWYLQHFSDSPMQYLVKNVTSLLNGCGFYRPRIRGEGSATYFVLDRDIIREVVTLNPDIKIIVLVRNPISRAWAHAKKALLNDQWRDIKNVSEQEFFDYFEHPYQKACGSYIDGIDRWLEFLSPSQLLVLFFDDISTKPVDVLLEAFDFLEVHSHPKYIDRKLSSRRIQKTDRIKERPILPKYQEALSALFSSELDHIEARFGRRPQT